MFRSTLINQFFIVLTLFVASLNRQIQGAHSAAAAAEPSAKIVLKTPQPTLTIKQQKEVNKKLFDAAESGIIHDAEVAIESGAHVTIKNGLKELGRTPLHVAVIHGHVDVIELLLKHGVNPNAKDNMGKPPVHYAKVNGHAVIVALLHSHGVQPPSKSVSQKLITKQQKEVNTNLFNAISSKFNNIAAMVAIQSGAQGDIKNENNEFGRTSLHMAALKGYASIVEPLLKRGANPNVTDTLEKTSLHYAAENGHVNVVELLLNKGLANPNVRDDRKRTPLFYAVKNGHVDTVELLLKREVNIDATDDSNKNLLCYAVESGHAGIVELLLKYGADPKVTGGLGKTFLHLAAENGHAGIVELLLNREIINTDATDAFGKTALFYAVIKGDASSVKLLFNYKVGSSVANRLDTICLHMEVEHRYAEIVRLIFKHEANPNVTAMFGNELLFYAAKKGDTNTVELLLNRELNQKINIDERDQNNQTVLHHAVVSGNADTVKLLLQRGADSKIIDASGKTFLHIAAENGYVGIVKLLLNPVFNPEININAKDNYKRTPLHCAVEKGHAGIVELLLNPVLNPVLNPKINVDEIDYDNRTPLHCAVEKGHADIVELLLKYGADPHVIDNMCGMTFLHIAAKNVHVDIVKTLLAAGVDPKVTDKSGKTSLDYAIKCREYVGKVKRDQTILVLVDAIADLVLVDAIADPELLFKFNDKLLEIPLFAGLQKKYWSQKNLNLTDLLLRQTYIDYQTDKNKTLFLNILKGQSASLAAKAMSIVTPQFWLQKGIPPEVLLQYLLPATPHTMLKEDVPFQMQENYLRLRVLSPDPENAVTTRDFEELEKKVKDTEYRKIMNFEYDLSEQQKQLKELNERWKNRLEEQERRQRDLNQVKFLTALDEEHKKVKQALLEKEHEAILE